MAVDWLNVEGWGGVVHIGLETGDTHTASEDAAEARRA